MKITLMAMRHQGHLTLGVSITPQEIFAYLLVFCVTLSWRQRPDPPGWMTIQGAPSEAVNHTHIEG